MDGQELLTETMEGKTLQLSLFGKIDSTNAPLFENKAMRLLEESHPEKVTLDCSALTYLSSAGLRVLLKIKKKVPDFLLRGVSPEVYEILDITGFSEMLKVERAIRELPVEDLPCIGKGATGSVYRINEEQIAKVFLPAMALEEVQAEQKKAKKALIAGVPACIPFEIIRSKDSYGIIYELIRSSTLLEYFQKDPGNTELIRQYAELLKAIHQIPFQGEGLGLSEGIALGTQHRLGEDFSPEEMQKILPLYRNLRNPGTFIHGDCHPGNVMVQDGELLFIDMTTANSGSPILDLLGVCSLYSRWHACPYEETKAYFGLEQDAAGQICRKTLQYYFDTEDQKQLDEVLSYLDGMDSLRMMVGARKFHLSWNLGEMKTRVLKAASMPMPALLREISHSA